MLEQDDYDLCIVGAGVAGALIATAAMKKGLKVAILEAGAPFNFNNRLDQLRRFQILHQERWPWERNERDAYGDSSSDSIGQPYALNRSRVKAVGGSTLHWGGRVNRLRESDFRTASLYGLGVDWPITYADLEPYYTRAEWALGVSGTPNKTDPPRSGDYPMPGFPMGYAEALWQPTAERLGLSLDLTAYAINSQPYAGRSQCLAYAQCSLCPSGARYSADFHIREAEASGFCTLFTETVARRIDMDNSGSVKAIHASKLDGQELEIRASNYIIAAHAVESARLLLLSNVGNHSGQVGRNFMEHIYLYGGGYLTNEHGYPYRIGFDRLESVYYYDGAERLDRGAIKLEFGTERDPLEDMKPMRLSGRKLAQHDCERFGRWVFTEAETEQQPNPNSRITLDGEKTDLFGDPAPHVHLKFSDVDRRTQQRAREIIAYLLEARGCKDIAIDQDFYFSAHHMGTCRMSSDRDLGVVDSTSRVHGTKNLYVAGSSVFPTAGARQPTITIAALSLRLADHLIGQSK